jgi:hypothetical protein
MDCFERFMMKVAQGGNGRCASIKHSIAIHSYKGACASGLWCGLKNRAFCGFKDHCSSALTNIATD